MESIYNVYESSLLGDINSTLKQGNEWAKKQREIADIKKNLYLLDDLYNNLGRRKGARTDVFGNNIEVGDVVLFKVDESDDEMSFGVVCRESYSVGGYIFYDIITASSKHYETISNDDPYDDCNICEAIETDIIVLAKKKNAKKMLELLTKIL